MGFRMRWMVALAAGLLLAGCDARAEPTPGSGEVLDAEVVEFDASGFHGPPFAAVIDDPRSADAFAGWFAGRADPPQVVRQPEMLGDLDAHAYVAAVTSTGCRLPSTATLRRVGAQLRVELLGGIDRPECVRAYTPFVVFEVRRSVLDGVESIAGAPLDRDGPAESVGRVELGPGAAEFAPREVTDPAALVAELGDGVREVLGRPSRLSNEYGSNGVRRYAFPVRACLSDLLTLRVSAAELRVEVAAAPDAPVTCEAPTPHLAVFDIRTVYVPEAARPVA